MRNLYPFFIFLFVIAVISCAIGWKIYEKAGQAGWASLIPFYNTLILLRIVGRPEWWLVLYFIPCVNVIVGIIVIFDLAKSFGKDVLFGLGLLFLGPIFLAILAFGGAEYVGPAAAPGGIKGKRKRSITEFDEDDEEEDDRPRRRNRDDDDDRPRRQ